MTKNILKFFSLPRTVLLIILIAFTLRVAGLSENLFFGYEQGRDLLAVKDIIVNKNLTLLGPKTDAAGVFHGPLSYYLLIPSFLITGGNPFLITVSLILLHMLALVLLYKANLELFGKKVAVFSVLLLSVSYSEVVYSRWLSNPNLIPALSIGLYYFLVKAGKNSMFLIPAAALFAVVFHLSLVSAGLLVPPILLALIIFKIKPTIKVFSLSALTALLILSSYPVFELRNDFLLTKGIQNLFAVKEGTALNIRSIEQFKNEIVDNVFPASRLLALSLFSALLVLALLAVKKETNVLVPIAFLLWPGFFFLLMGFNPLRHTFITIAPFLATMLALGLNVVSQRSNLLSKTILALIVFGSALTYWQRIPTNIGSFLQNDQHAYLGPELKSLDFAYKDAAREAFNYEYYSIPYWKNEGWKYLFEWYGQKKYGYNPQEKETKVFYLFIEPDISQKLHQKNWYLEVNTKSRLIEARTFDKLIVEKRERI